MSEDMILLTRTFDLFDWLLPKSERFPKVYRFTVTQRMMDAALDFQEALFDALSQRGTTRQKYLRTAVRTSISCGSICGWRTGGSGSTMVSTGM